MKIYTRKGDDGTTGLWYGGRVPKYAGRPEAYGSVDEAASALAEIEGNYDSHSRAAREIATEYFRAETVLESLLERTRLGAHAGTR
jgi:cob(I)alamin adenosyltransferase